MKGKALIDEGRVVDSIQELAGQLRVNPTDVAARRLLIDLLCCSGQYERARKHVDILAVGGPGYEVEALQGYATLHAEETRYALYTDGNVPREEAPPPAPGLLNGKPFRSIRDTDPDIGARLEVFAHGTYAWIPFAHLTSVQMHQPATLHETLWSPAKVRTNLGHEGKDLGDVTLPSVYAFSWRHPDETVWLGRLTAWMVDDDGEEFPVGQKLLLVDGEEVPFLEIRTLEFTARAGVAG
ncbi:MAG: type VI secretion system accessory protein TagJ [Bryobacteraceae bacterium]